MDIIQIGEFIDVLRSLLRGNVLVSADLGLECAVIDGNMVYYAFATLLKGGVIAEFKNTDGFENVKYFRLSTRGRWFAVNAVKIWDAKPWYERALLRLCR